MEDVKQSKTVFAFIDATNIIYGCGSAGWKVDFEKLAKYLRTRYQVDKIFYYAGVDDKNLKQLKFYGKTFSDGSKKADVDSRMTFEMMLHFGDYTDAIIFTGDGDYYWVIEHLLKTKNSVKLFGSGKTIAHELKQLLEGNVTNIQLIRNIIGMN